MSRQVMDEESSQDSWVRIDSESDSSSSESSVTSCTERLVDTITTSNHCSLESAGIDVLIAPNQELLLPVVPPPKTKTCDYDWSSRCEALPPKKEPYLRLGDEQFVSRTPTPTWPVSSCEKFRFPPGLRHSKLIRYDWFTVELLFTHMVSFLLGGVCVWIYYKGYSSDCVITRPY